MASEKMPLTRYGMPMNGDADLAARLVVVDAARELVASGAATEDVFALIRARTAGVIGQVWIVMRTYGIGILARLGNGRTG